MKTLSFFKFNLFQALVFCTAFSLIVYISNGKSHGDLHYTNMGYKIPKNVLAPSIGHSNEKEWNSRIFEVMKLGESVKIVGLNTVHDFSGSVVTRHEIKSENSSKQRSKVPMFIDGVEIKNYSFTYFSHKMGNDRILTDTSGKVFSGLVNGTSIYPLHARNHDSVLISKPELLSTDAGNELLQKQLRLTPSMKKASVSCRPTGQPLLFELALTYDSTMCKLFGYDKDYTVAAMNDVIHSAMIPFHRQTCIRHDVVAVAGYCDTSKDPYRRGLDSKDPENVFKDMRNEWHGKRGTYSNIKRDFVYLLVGNKVKLYAGMSYVCSMCSKKNDFAWSVYRFGSGAITHELGHAFGGAHVEGSGVLGSPNSNLEKWFTVENLSSMQKCINKKIGTECLSDGDMQPRFEVFKDRRYTCQTGFKLGWRSRSPREKGWTSLGKRSVKYYRWDLRKYEYVPVSGEYYQTDDLLRIRVKFLKPLYGARSYFRAVSLSPLKDERLQVWGPSVDVQKETIFSFGATDTILSEWTWSEIDRPKSVSSCCDRPLYISIIASLCKLPWLEPHTCRRAVINFRLSKIECLTKE